MKILFTHLFYDENLNFLGNKVLGTNVKEKGELKLKMN